MVDAADEAAFGVAAKGVFEFEVAAAGGVDGEAVVAVFALRRGERRQGLFVGVVEVLQQAAGGADGWVVVCDAVAVQGFGLVVLEEEVQGAVGVKVPVGLAARAGRGALSGMRISAGRRRSISLLSASSVSVSLRW